jgi:hypothetical protein
VGQFGLLDLTLRIIVEKEIKAILDFTKQATPIFTPITREIRADREVFS